MPLLGALSRDDGSTRRAVTSGWCPRPSGRGSRATVAALAARSADGVDLAAIVRIAPACVPACGAACWEAAGGPGHL